MATQRTTELAVGIFILAGALGIFALAFQVSGLSSYSERSSYQLSAMFSNIGDLKQRAPVTIAGVRIGEVYSIAIDHTSFKANVVMRISKQHSNLPVDTSARILTAGIIGANYIELVPGYEEKLLQNGEQITDTQSAVVLENLIGQLMYSFGNSGKDKNKK